MKFRKKPVVIDAEQFHEYQTPYPVGVLTRPKVVGMLGGPLHFYIETLEGEHIVSDGDWIVTGVKGERYPVKPDIFEATYDRVEQ